VPVFQEASLRRHPELIAIVEQLAGRLSAATMQKLNAAVDQQRQTPEQVVCRWRQETGLAAAIPGPDSRSGSGPGSSPGPDSGHVTGHSPSLVSAPVPAPDTP
jgi:hypothetical protein